jgi:uncharacterized protein YqhQ
MLILSSKMLSHLLFRIKEVLVILSAAKSSLKALVLLTYLHRISVNQKINVIIFLFAADNHTTEQCCLLTVDEAASQRQREERIRELEQTLETVIVFIFAFTVYIICLV